MYIIVVSRGYPSPKYKMNGIFEFDQAKALAQAGHKVILAALDLRSFRRTRKWGFESLKKDGVQIEAINVPCGRLSKGIFSEISKLALRMLYKKIYFKYGEPDIIHAHFIGCGYITASIFQGSNIPLVLTEHYSGINRRQIDEYLVRLGNYCYPRMDKVIAVSNCLANNIKVNFNVNPIVIPNIVDTTKFNYSHTQKKSTMFNFVCTGSLSKNKGMDILINAFNKEFKSNKKVNLFIYGNGPERDNLENIIQEYNLNEQIFLMGLVDRKELAIKMAESDCFVLASKSETFGLAYVEAMAMGLPIIGTMCGGPEDYISENNGVLVPVDSVDELAVAMRNVYENIDFYNRETISNVTINEFCSQTIEKKLSEVYGNLLKTKRIRK